MANAVQKPLPLADAFQALWQSVEARITAAEDKAAEAMAIARAATSDVDSFMERLALATRGSQSNGSLHNGNGKHVAGAEYAGLAKEKTKHEKPKPRLVFYGLSQKHQDRIHNMLGKRGDYFFPITPSAKVENADVVFTMLAFVPPQDRRKIHDAHPGVKIVAHEGNIAGLITKVANELDELEKLTPATAS